MSKAPHSHSSSRPRPPSRPPKTHQTKDKDGHRPNLVLRPEILAEAIERMKITHAKLAEIIGVDRSQIGRWLRAEHMPDGDHLIYLALALDTTAGALCALEARDLLKARTQLWAIIRNTLGADEASILQLLSEVSTEDKAILASKISGWIEARSK